MKQSHDGESVQPEVQAIAEKMRAATPSSRRRFLQRSAEIGGGALALAFVGSNAALAGSGDDVNENDATDLEVLQFALTLEHLENAFYRDVGSRFDEKDYRRAAFLRGFGNRIRQDVRGNFEVIGEHERIHVVFLTEFIEDNFDEDPVEEANYDFGVDDVDEFASIARLLENTGVSAYAGSISSIDTPAIATVGATIATVEARHASYLDLLIDDDPFPDAFDTAVSREDTLEAASGFFE